MNHPRIPYASPSCPIFDAAAFGLLFLFFCCLFFFYRCLRVTCVGYTDLPSRLPQTSSQLYANNIAKLILATGPQTTKDKGYWYIDHEDPVSRGMLVVENGKVCLFCCRRGWEWGRES